MGAADPGGPRRARIAGRGPDGRNGAGLHVQLPRRPARRAFPAATRRHDARGRRALPLRRARQPRGAPGAERRHDTVHVRRVQPPSARAREPAAGGSLAPSRQAGRWARGGTVLLRAAAASPPDGARRARRRTAARLRLRTRPARARHRRGDAPSPGHAAGRNGAGGRHHAALRRPRTDRRARLPRRAPSATPRLPPAEAGSAAIRRRWSAGIRAR